MYDPAADGVISASSQAQRADYTPYEGWKTVGSIAQVYLRGQLAVDHGEILETPIADTEHLAMSAPIISSYCAASVLWSRIFLKEKLSWKHYGAKVPAASRTQ